MTKPTDTRKWTQEDIKDVKEALPEGVGFGTLTSPDKRDFKLDLGRGVRVEEIDDLVEDVVESMAFAGVPTIEHVRLDAGYCGGSMSPHVLLTLRMEVDDD